MSTRPKLTPAQQLDKIKRRVQQALTAAAYKSTEAFCRARGNPHDPQYVRLKGMEQTLFAVQCLLRMDEGQDRLNAWVRFTTSELGLA